MLHLLSLAMLFDDENNNSHEPIMLLCINNKTLYFVIVLIERSLVSEMTCFATLKNILPLILPDFDLSKNFDCRT